MHLLGQRISDKRIMKLIGRYLRVPMDEGGGRHIRRSRGTLQGGPLSPLLANLYLDVLERELERRGSSFVRYADDIAIFVTSERAAERVLERLTRWLHRHLDLEVNAAKSGAHRTEETALLGFRIHPGGQVSPAPKAIERFKDRVRELWDARQSLTSKQLREQWQRYVTGWWNYTSYRHKLTFLECLKIQCEQRFQLLFVRCMCLVKAISNGVSEFGEIGVVFRVKNLFLNEFPEPFDEV